MPKRPGPPHWNPGPVHSRGGWSAASAAGGQQDASGGDDDGGRERGEWAAVTHGGASFRDTGGEKNKASLTNVGGGRATPARMA